MTIFLPCLVSATGNRIAACILSQIMYWHQGRLRIRRNGTYWLVKSRKDFCEEIGITLDQYKRNMPLLVQLGFVVTERGLFKNKVTPFIQLTNVGQDLMAEVWPKKAPLVQKCTNQLVQKCTNQLVQKCTNQLVQKCTNPYTENTTESTTENTTEKKRGSLSLAATPEENFPPTQLGENMKGEERKTLVQVLEGVKKKPTEPSMEGVKLTATSIANYWRSLVRYFGHADFTHPPTKKELGMWAQMVKLEPQLLPVIVRHVVEDWDGFSRDAMMSSGMKGRPMDPMVEYLRKHLTIAVNWYTTKTAPKVVSASKPSTVYVVPKKEKVVTSSDPVDWAKIEAEIAQEQDEGNFGEPSS